MIELEMFASGDTDYIAKLNSNMSQLMQAVSALQAQAEAGASGGGASTSYFLGLLFNQADGLIGVDSYKPTPSGSTLTVAVGGAFLAANLSVVQSFSPVNLSFTGQPAATYYVVIDAAGMPNRSTGFGAGAMYSVSWSGSSFGNISRVVPAYFDVTEADGSRTSTALHHGYHVLDDRLEAGEGQIAGAVSAANAAASTANVAMAQVTQLRADMGAAAVFSIRKVGVTVDNSTGVKGTIQVDFEGTIIGWSCIADGVGSVAVEVWKAASSPPPAAPAIPVVGGKISASSPIALSGVQSAARAAAGVATWNTSVRPWDVFSFNVASVSGINRATLYFRVQETPPPAGVTAGTIASTLDIGITMGPFIVAGGVGTTVVPLVPGATGFGMETRAAYGGGVSPTIISVTIVTD